MAEVLANGVRLHVQRLSSREASRPDPPVVVTLHGMVVDNVSSFYFSLGTSLAHVGADVICYDLRGHGRSERTPEGYAMADSLADLSALLDALGIDRPVHLVGNSYGATIALSCGLDFPDRVASLTLIEPPFLIEGLGAQMNRSLTQVAVGLSEAEFEQGVAHAANSFIARNIRRARSLLQETSIAQDMLETEPFSPERLARLRVPVLAVYGGNSNIIDQAEALAAHLPDCTLVVLEQHTHLVLGEATEYLRMLVRWWLFQRDAPMPTYAPESVRLFEIPAWVTEMATPADTDSPRPATPSTPSGAGASK